MALADAHRRGSRATRRIKGSGFPPPGAITRVWMLSPDDPISISPFVNVPSVLRTLAYFVDEFPAALLLHSAVLSCSTL